MSQLQWFKQYFFYKMKKILRPNGREDFISNLPNGANLLDVGCGNNSPFKTKIINNSLIYTGLDIGDYNQTTPNLADKYILSTPEEFALTISKMTNSFDAVISSHNLEHCDDRQATLIAMLDSIKVGGRLFISFPSERSVEFPSRGGTLNYFDDPTHKLKPPSYAEVIQTIISKGFEIQFQSPNYSPVMSRFLGFILEPLSRLRNQVMFATLAFYGYETIIIAKKSH